MNIPEFNPPNLDIPDIPEYKVNPDLSRDIMPNHPIESGYKPGQAMRTTYRYAFGLDETKWPKPMGADIELWAEIQTARLRHFQMVMDAYAEMVRSKAIEMDIDIE